MSHQHELKARRQQLEQLLQGSPYLSYLYSYPHKTAHRPLDPPRPLGALWREERRHALFLYLHVPFCAMHCGYCNLLSNKSRPRPEQIAGFLGALERQAAAVQQALGSVTFARLAIGGGTPTVLTEAELSRLLQVAESMVGGELDSLPSAVEVSPETASEAKLCLLRERGISRLSIGIQSFIQDELRALGRAQTVRRAHESLQRIFELEFPTVNIDLIYGIEGQTEASLGDSLGQALRYQPTEIFLYPLYVRPLTPLGQAEQEPTERRLALYRRGRDYLLQSGYRQLSMRMFRRDDGGGAPEGPSYRCQEDGMVGLGCGARSYTEYLHYSSPFAVSPAAVDELIAAYSAKSPEAFAQADYGVVIDEEDRRRRHVILSLLQAKGMDLVQYEERFGSRALDDLPELAELGRLELACQQQHRLVLSEQGLERSDLIGPWLRSERIKRLMDSYPLR